MIDSETSFIPIYEAILLLDTTVDGIMMLIESNKLHGKMIDGIWCVDQSSLKAYDKSKAAIQPEGCGVCGSSCGSGC